MNAKVIAQGIINAVLKLTALVVGLWLLYALRTLVVYFLIAAVVSLIGRPIKRFLDSKLRFGGFLATTVTIAFLLAVLFGVFSLFVPLLLQQSENLSLLDVDTLKNTLERLFNQISDNFNLGDTSWNQLTSGEGLFERFNFGLVSDFLNEILGILGGFTIGLFSVLFISFFLLKDSSLLERMILTLVKEKVESRAAKSFEKIKDLLSRYFLGLLMQVTILLIIYSIVLLVFGIQNAFIIAFLCALLNLIPYLGPIVGGVLMLILTMTSNLDADFNSVILPKTLYVMIGFAIGQLVDNFFSQPIIFSNSVRSHPLEIFIVILASGTLLGPLGMIVAIPFYTALKVILKEFLSENKIVQSLTKNL